MLSFALFFLHSSNFIFPKLEHSLENIRAAHFSSLRIPTYGLVDDLELT